MAHETSSSERLKVVSTLLATVFIPVVLGLVGHWYTAALKDREIQSRYIELAINILNEEPSDQNKKVRSWAARIIDKYSEIKIGEAEEEILMHRLTSERIETVAKLIESVGKTAGDIARTLP